MEPVVFPLYLIKVPRQELNFWKRVHKFDSYIKNYLKLGMNRKYKHYKQYEESKTYRNYQRFVGYYAKTVWLTKEYFENNKEFKIPLGLRRNNSEKWDIHPGGHRNTVIYYFPNELILGLTQDYADSYIKEFESIDELKIYFNTSDIGIEFNKFPEIHIDTNPQYALVNKTIRNLREFFNTTHIDSNFNLKEWGYDKKTVKRVKKHIRVTIDDSTNDIQIIRSFLLMPTFDNFDGYGVKIETIG
jgi:hypothetical protein